MVGGHFIYSCAVSADGFIAPTDGSVDWLAGFPPPEEEFQALAERTRIILFGRTTFDQATGFGGEWPYAGKRCVVLSHRPAPATLPPGIEAEFTAEPLPALCDRLRAAAAQQGGDVWVIGGADVAGQVLAAGQLDELELGIIPVVLGAGIRLFPERAAAAYPLRLLGQRPVGNSGLLMVRYTVERKRA